MIISEQDAKTDQLDELKLRIAKAQKVSEGTYGAKGDGATPQVKAWARVLRIGIDFISTVLAGLGLGWFADEQLGTAPWGLISLLLVGFVVAFWSLIQTEGARRSDREKEDEING